MNSICLAYKERNGVLLLAIIQRDDFMRNNTCLVNKFANYSIFLSTSRKSSISNLLFHKNTIAASEKLLSTAVSRQYSKLIYASMTTFKTNFPSSSTVLPANSNARFASPSPLNLCVTISSRLGNAIGPFAANSLMPV